jgi:hypothetical protein
MKLTALKQKYGYPPLPSEHVSPAKARRILHEGQVGGRPLTAKQRRMFGAASQNPKRRRVSAVERRDLGLDLPVPSLPIVTKLGGWLNLDNRTLALYAIALQRGLMAPIMSPTYTADLIRAYQEDDMGRLHMLVDPLRTTSAFDELVRRGGIVEGVPHAAT